jgi:maltooligosyltrehalose trehalohydrolase
MESNHGRRCGAIGLPDGAARWRVWAPRAARVELVLHDGADRRVFPMQAEERGFHQLSRPSVADGQRYAYRLDGGPERPDPCSLWQPDGVHGPSALVRPGRFRWTDADWKGVPREDLVFYELHVGTFTPDGTFDAIIPRLPALRELGVTAIELMPVGQFPGDRNWGYDGVFPYAAQNSYGGPEGLQRLVDACHRVGLAVFLDVIYNHLGPEGNYLSEFGPYFTDRYKTGWGPALNYDDAGSDPVRDYILDNARMWLEEFHLDGLRLDAVHAILDMSPRHILRAIKEVADASSDRVGRPLHVIAESDLNDPRLMLPVDRGGDGLDGQWSDDFHHAVHAWVTGETQGYYVDFGRPEQLAQVLEQPFLYAGTYSPHRDRKHGAPPTGLSGDRFVVAIQNHDQVGNRARGDRLAALADVPRQRLAASLLLLAPHLPLLFMGEEYGEDRPFPFFCSFGDPHLIQAVRDGRQREFAAFAWQGEVPDPHDPATFAAAKLRWAWPEGTPQAGLRRLYTDLLAARRTWPALRDFTHRSVRLLQEEDGKIIDFTRGDPVADPKKAIRCLINLTPQRQSLPKGIALPPTLLFSSEARTYCGSRDVTRPVAELLPAECAVFGHK